MTRLHLLAGTSLLALAVAGPAAQAGTFDYTGKIVSFTVKRTGTYFIEATGAQGAGGGTGGLGAEIAGDFKLTKGEDLLIAVGGKGHDGSAPQIVVGSGGGGGSFVVEKLPNPLGDFPLVIAGGGGGGGTNGGGGGGGTGKAGGSGSGYLAGAGGTAGHGGAGGYFSGGGGGLDSAGGGGPYGGHGFPGLAGGGGGGGPIYGYANGGFGGGGGGGGGYSGGGGGGSYGGGGGGGSFDGGTDQILKAAFRKGNGGVLIRELSATATVSPALIDASLTSGAGDPPAVPEPASAALLGAGLLGFAGVRRGTKRR